MPAILTTRAPRLPVLAIVIALSLSACGGGSGGGGDGGGAPPGGGTNPSPAIDVLLGDWQQKGCVTIGAQSFRKVLRASRTAANTIDYFEGVRTYGSTDCSGLSILTGPSRLGSVSFARAEANPQLAAYWGEYLTVTNTRFGAIWAIKSGGLLCLLGDEIPSIQPTLASVATSLATVPEANCFNQ